jgi:hypothetical protein
MTNSHLEKPSILFLVVLSCSTFEFSSQQIKTKLINVLKGTGSTLVRLATFNNVFY